jgi:photosystem II stability/assembly factor-like uncharacterized protein
MRPLFVALFIGRGRLLVAGMLILGSFSCKKNDIVTNPNTGGQPSKLLSAPYNLAAAPVSISEIDLQWKDSASDVTGFVIEKSVDTSRVWSVLDTISSSSRTYQHTSLLCNTAYTYRIYAFNSHRNSYNSNLAMAKTLLGTTTTIDLHTSTDLYAILFPTTALGLAAGARGRILRTVSGGTSWDSIASGSTATLKGIAFLNSSVGKIVGSSGTILGTMNGGLTWTPEKSGTTSELRSAKAIDSLHWIAVGVSGVILYTSDGGSNWERHSSPSTISFNSVAFATTTVGYIVGTVGTLLVTTNGGLSWANKTINVSTPLTSIAFSDSLHGIIVGSQPVILRTVDGGLTWESTANPTDPLSGVAFASASAITAVGLNGAVYASVDGGQSWVREVFSIGAMLSSIASISGNEFFLVGLRGIGGDVVVCTH